MNLFTHRPRAARACLPGGTRNVVGWYAVSGSQPGAMNPVGGQGSQGTLRSLRIQACSSARLSRREDADFAKESDR